MLVSSQAAVLRILSLIFPYIVFDTAIDLDCPINIDNIESQEIIVIEDDAIPQDQQPQEQTNSIRSMGFLCQQP